MLERVERPCGYARAMIGMTSSRWLFGMPWLTGPGAHQTDQIVERGNIPALRLYEQAGFTEICGFQTGRLRIRQVPATFGGS